MVESSVRVPPFCPPLVARCLFVSNRSPTIYPHIAHYLMPSSRFVLPKTAGHPSRTLIVASYCGDLLILLVSLISRTVTTGPAQLVIACSVVSSRAHTVGGGKRLRSASLLASFLLCSPAYSIVHSLARSL